MRTGAEITAASLIRRLHEAGAAGGADANAIGLRIGLALGPKLLAKLEKDLTPGSESKTMVETGARPGLITGAIRMGAELAAAPADASRYGKGEYGTQPDIDYMGRLAQKLGVPLPADYTDQRKALEPLAKAIGADWKNAVAARTIGDRLADRGLARSPDEALALLRGRSAAGRQAVMAQLQQEGKLAGFIRTVAEHGRGAALKDMLKGTSFQDDPGFAFGPS